MLKKLKFNKKEIIGIFMLVLIDQFIKIFIWYFFYEHKKTKIIEGLLYFAPYLNTKFAYVFSLFNIPVSRILILLITALCFYLVSKIRQCLVNTISYNQKQLSLMSMNLFLAGIGCSFVDRLIWGGSLDYIYVEHLWIMDLKDIYVFISSLLLAYVYIANYKTLKQVKIVNLIKNIF